MYLFFAQAIDEARSVLGENLTLVAAVALTALVGWWIFKKVFKLALYAGIAGALAWFWYFNLRG